MIARRTRLLAHTFFGRLFENDVFSSSVAASTSVVWMLAALAMPGVMFSGSQIFSWAHLRAMGERMRDPLIVDTALLRQQAFHVDFVMAVSAVVTMLVWSSLTPDRRDALVLGPLPIGMREQAHGRLLAILKFFGLFLVAVSVPNAFAFNFVAIGAENVGDFPARVVGHVVSMMLAGGSVCFTLVAIQLVLAAAFGPRAVRAVTLPLQLAAFAGMIMALASAESFARAMLEQGTGAGVLWNPAAWFLGVYRWVGGDGRAVFTDLASRGLVAGAGLIALTVVAYPLAYDRCLRNALDSEGRGGGRLSRAGMRLAARAMAPFLRTPLERGLAAYMTATLVRSQSHRFLLGSYAAVACLCALPLAGRLLHTAATDTEKFAWFSVPLGVMCWMAAALRVAIMLPVEPRANWIFQLTEPVDKRRVLTTAVTLISAATAAPLALVFGVGAAVVGGLTLGATVGAVVLLTGLGLAELLTLTLRTVPFSCTYRPGQLRLRVLWPVYLFSWIAIAFRLPNAALWARGDASKTAWLLGGLGGAWLLVRLWRLARVRKLRAFVYDEDEGAFTTTIELGQARI